MIGRNSFIFLLLLALCACAPTAAYQARDNLGQASREASCQAQSSRQEKVSLEKDQLRMQGDINKIKQAEKMFDQRQGIVLSY